jgi:hypothetical protein
MTKNKVKINKEKLRKRTIQLTTCTKLLSKSRFNALIIEDERDDKIKELKKSNKEREKYKGEIMEHARQMDQALKEKRNWMKK